MCVRLILRERNQYELKKYDISNVILRTTTENEDILTL